MKYKKGGVVDSQHTEKRTLFMIQFNINTFGITESET